MHYKLSLLLTFILSLPLLLPAQSTFGLRGGVSYGLHYGSPESFMGEDIETADPDLGYQFGIASYHPVSGSFGLMVDLLYESRKGKKEIDFTLTPRPGLDLRTRSKLTNTFNYLSVPVLAAFTTGFGKFYIGPGFSYLLSANSEIATTTTTDPEEAGGTNGLPPNGTTRSEIDLVNDDRYDNSYIDRFNIGANLGLQFALTDHLAFDLRVFHTLLDLTNDEEDEYIIDRAVGQPFPPRTRDDFDSSAGAQLNVVLEF